MGEVLAERLKRIRKEKGYTQNYVALSIGVKPPQLSKWESGTTAPSRKNVEQLAKLYGVTMDYLMGIDEVVAAFPNAYPMPPQSHLPIYGAIKCGPGGLAMEELLGYAESVKDPATHFCLMCYGDSMLPDFRDGDMVVIHQQEDVETGEIAAVIVDGEEGTLKRIVKQGNAITLVALNPAYQPRTFIGEDMNRVHIVGKVVEMKRTY